MWTVERSFRLFLTSILALPPGVSDAIAFYARLCCSSNGQEDFGLQRARHAGTFRRLRASGGTCSASGAIDEPGCVATCATEKAETDRFAYSDIKVAQVALFL